MHRTLTIPGRLYPPHSLFGRWIVRRTGDLRAGVTTYIVVVVLLVLGLVLAHVFTWSYLQPFSGAELRVFVGIELALTTLFAFVVLAGRQQPIRITLDEERLIVERVGQAEETIYGSQRRVVRRADILSAAVLDAQTYHTRHARYACTDPFVNRLHATVILLETPSGPIILGVDPVSQEVLLGSLLEDIAEPYVKTRIGAA